VLDFGPEFRPADRSINGLVDRISLKLKQGFHERKSGNKVQIWIAILLRDVWHGPRLSHERTKEGNQAQYIQGSRMSDSMRSSNRMTLVRSVSQTLIALI